MQQFDVELSMTASAGFDLKVLTASSSQTFTIGTSLSKSETISDTEEYTVTITRDFEVEAPSGTLVTAQLYWRKVNYHYT